MVTAIFMVELVAVSGAMAATPETMQDKLVAVEKAAYGEAQTGALLDRVSRLEKDFTKSQPNESVMKRVDDIYEKMFMNDLGPSLITQMNKFIRSQREEDQKTAEREARNQPPPEPLRPAEPTERMTKVEQLLIEMVMRHGEEVILNTEGQDVNVAQFIYYSLSEDGMSFQNELYNKVLEEVINHCDEPGFKAETYFTHHSDIEINTLAAKLCTDRFMLSPSMQVRQEEDSLKQQVVHLLYDFQLGHVEIELQQLKRELKQCDGDVEKMMALMKSIKDYQELRNKIGQKLGRKIVGIR